MAESTTGWQCLFKLWRVSEEWVLATSHLHHHLPGEHVRSLHQMAPHWRLFLTWAVVTGKVTATPCLTGFNINYRMVYMGSCSTALVVVSAHGCHLETCLGIMLWRSMSQWLIKMACLLQQFICPCRYSISLIILTVASRYKCITYMHIKLQVVTFNKQYVVTN